MSEKFDQWALIEILGHNRYAGRVTEQSVGGNSFVRVDIPESDEQPAFTKLFGASSIYCITPVTEDVARRMSATLRQTPISVYDLPSDVRAALATPSLAHSGADEYPDELDDDEY